MFQQQNSRKRYYSPLTLNQNRKKEILYLFGEVIVLDLKDKLYNKNAKQGEKMKFKKNTG